MSFRAYKWEYLANLQSPLDFMSFYAYKWEYLANLHGAYVIE